MDTREHLKKLQWEYKVDTLKYIQTVRDFCDKQHKWTLEREKELKMMGDIKDKKSPDKELEKELGAVLENTLQGLKKLYVFLDAVEKLAVTSLFVFTGQSFMSEDESPESVRSVIMAARMTCPLLINFKRNAETFFFPSLSNLAVLSFQLDKYIRITKQICERMEERCMKAQPVVKFSLNLSKDSMQKMLDHLKQLSEIRMDQHTRLALIFQELKAQEFVGLFSQCLEKLEKHLSDLEESAVQLDRMKMGASISTVTGSSVSILAGGLSIAGLILAPFTAGTSLALTKAGLGLGVTSGANSLVTGATELGVNLRHGKKTQDIFKQYMKDVEKILSCLDQASKQEQVEGQGWFDIIITAGKLAGHAVSVGKGIDGLADAASAVKILKTEEVIATATKAGLQEAQGARNIPKLAADLPDIGKLAKGTPLALSKSARAGFIGLNALFIGLDIFFIFNESISLAKGSKCEASQHIRSRAALWRSELEDWKKIHDSLRIGIERVRKSQEVLEQPFLHQESQPHHQQLQFYPVQNSSASSWWR
ncbi:apolipoprotein L2-like [Pimephales promelas]|uniref:apolipoprotein L2-like n=1 Tax=Pimephales promelas TaxID=90988 RepID=UPI001955E09C|nr:apolipoprotein L2-like [Pimephales promelas]